MDNQPDFDSVYNNQELEKKKKGGITLGKSKPKEPEFTPQLKNLSADLSDLNRRIRTLEGRYTTLQTKTQITEQNMLTRHKQNTIEFKTINMDVNEIKKNISEIKDRILLLIKEIQECAKKQEVKVLEKYINLWEPVNFVTRHEFEEELKKLQDQIRPNIEREE